MIRETIDAINELITSQITSEAVQVSGLAVPFQDQQEKTITVGIPGDTELARFTIDDAYVWQSLHLFDRTVIANSRTFGSFTDRIHNVSFYLIGLSKSFTGVDVAYRALDSVGYVVIDNLEQDTLTVLTRYLRIKTGQEKNYDPSLVAFAIRYHIEGVTDDDITEIPTEADLAALPVEDPLLPTVPEKPVSTSYIKRSDFVKPFSYMGVAVADSSESASVWKISRIQILNNGNTLTKVATGVAWTSRLTATYS